MKEKIDLAKEGSILSENLDIIEGRSEEAGGHFIEIGRAKQEICLQLSRMVAIIECLEIENHNLKDKIIQLEGKH